MVHRRKGQWYLGITPSRKQRQRLKASLRDLVRAAKRVPTEDLVETVNRKLRGWANYFSKGTLNFAYREIDNFTTTLLRGFLTRRHNVPGRGTRRFSDEVLHREVGVARLRDRLPMPTSKARA